MPRRIDGNRPEWVPPEKLVITGKFDGPNLPGEMLTTVTLFDIKSKFRVKNCQPKPVVIYIDTINRSMLFHREGDPMDFGACRQHDYPFRIFIR